MTARRAAFPPPGYRWVRMGRHTVVAWEPAIRRVRDALSTAATFHAWASREGRRAATGRGAVYVAQLGEARVAVRHYRRGGWMRWLRDRYLGLRPRPFHELAVSEAARSAGVPTPRVVAAVVTAAKPGYRGDVAVEWLEPGHDLERLLEPGAYPERARAAGLRAAGRAIGLGHRAGLDHADLQHRNVFVRPRPGGGWEAWLLDLDRARIRSRSTGFKKKTSRASSGR